MMPECCGRFFSVNGMRNHLDNSYAHADEIECRWCYRRWPTHDGNARLEHEQRNHWSHCDDCDRIFKDKDDLKDHIEDDHPPNYCYGCQRRFASTGNLDQHLKSSVHVGKNVKCPWCPKKYTNLTGVCHHLESGDCSSGINRQKINQFCRDVDRGHLFTNKQIGWHDEDQATDIATDASWDGDFYRCYFCQKGFSRLTSLNQHLASPAHQQKIYHCPRCQNQYVALSGLVNHLESETCGAFRFQNYGSGFGFVNQMMITR